MEYVKQFPTIEKTGLLIIHTNCMYIFITYHFYYFIPYSVSITFLLILY